MDRIGTVYLRVANLKQQQMFYENIIGLQTHRQENDIIFMGVGDQDLLALVHKPQAKRRQGHNGLYHFALLVPSRVHLAQALHHLIATETRLQGLGDHIVSEAIYLADPEGNGIEIYADRSRDYWYKDGEFQMATLPVDVNDLLNTASAVDRESYQFPQGTMMGHIHLHVDNIEDAVQFYRDTIGMEVMFQLPSAAFLSYDGYHHHIGVNIWAGQVHHSDDTLGLDHFDLHLTDAQVADLQADSTRQKPLTVEDPSTNAIFIQQVIHHAE